MSDYIIDTSDAAFEADVLQSEIPVLLDFWAPWCGPCLAIAPLLEDIAAEYAGRAKVVKVNVDDNKQYAEQYGVQGIPTLILFKPGGEIAYRDHATTRTRLRVLLDDLTETTEPDLTTLATLTTSPCFNNDAALKQQLLDKLRANMAAAAEQGRRVAPLFLQNGPEVAEQHGLPRQWDAFLSNDEHALKIVEAIIPGADLAEVTRKFILHLLYGEEGLQFTTPEGPLTPLIERLAAFHNGLELVDGTDWRKLRKDVVAATDAIAAEHGYSALVRLAVLAEGAMSPLEEIEASTLAELYWIGRVAISLAMTPEDVVMQEEREKAMHQDYGERWKELGEWPDEPGPQHDALEAQANAIIESVQEEHRSRYPEHFAKQEQREDEALRLYGQKTVFLIDLIQAVAAQKGLPHA
ncbi:thioredoxin [Phyllobacterium endophyticum]|nr:thioredoxin [Phyllobacterium endophyticum]TXR49813.1 thioredoxin [Phyllobacterium endophyticum]